jgi:hypothetical protein
MTMKLTESDISALICSNVDMEEYYGSAVALVRRTQALVMERVKAVLAEHRTVGAYKPYEDNYASGWTDAVNAIAWEINEEEKPT